MFFQLWGISVFQSWHQQTFSLSIDHCVLGDETEAWEESVWETQAINLFCVTENQKSENTGALVNVWWDDRVWYSPRVSSAWWWTSYWGESEVSQSVVYKRGRSSSLDSFCLCWMFTLLQLLMLDICNQIKSERFLLRTLCLTRYLKQQDIFLFPPFQCSMMSSAGISSASMWKYSMPIKADYYYIKSLINYLVEFCHCS